MGGQSTTIPQDIMATATELVATWQGADVVTVAAGILAERERCAEVVRDSGPTTQDMESTFICDALERAALDILQGATV